MNTFFRMLLTFFLSTLLVSGGDSDAEYEAAVSLIKAKNYTAAETLLNAAISKRPDSPEVHYALGFAVERQNRKSEAVASYLKTVETVLAGPGGRGWDEARKVGDKAFEALERIVPGRTALLRSAAELETEAVEMAPSEKKVIADVVAEMPRLHLRMLRNLPPRTVR